MPFDYPGISYPWRSRSNITTITTVLGEDATNYGLRHFEVMRVWANAIRNAVNGWNCTKDAQNYPLYCNGYICSLAGGSGSSYYFNPGGTYDASVYGVGEKQPSFQTANANIFHTCDITIARPSNKTDWPLNRWVRIYGNIHGSAKTLAVRITDTCGTTKVDLSSGAAYLLGNGNQWPTKVTFVAV